MKARDVILDALMRLELTRKRETSTAILSALDDAGFQVVPKELDGKMWAAGRSVFVREAETYRAQTTDIMAQAHADRAPGEIYSAIILAASGEKIE